MVEELAPERDLARNPLIQVMCGFQTFSRQPATELRGLSFEAPAEEAVDTGTSKFDLTFYIVDTGAEIRGVLSYNSDLFDATTIHRLLGQYEGLLRAAVEDSRSPVGELPLLSAGESHQLTAEWNDTASVRPGAGLGEIFAACARRDPAATALEWAGGTLSYGDLDRRANRVAHRLRALGVGLESRVALCLERSPELIVGLLGIVKAGGAYVPLDPAYPRERLSFMLRDAGVSALVAASGTVTALPEAPAAVILLDGLDELDGTGEDAAAPVADGGGLAYVMYTSGSTGRPKGVAVPQRAVARLVLGSDYAHFGPDEVFLQLAPVSFDASTLEIWGPLLHGGRLALAPPRQLSLEEIAGEVERRGVTTLWLTAGLFHQMVDGPLRNGHAARLRSLRQLLAGGEALSAPHVRRALAALPGLRLINGYGPTENTTFTCCYPMSDASALGASVPLGRPIGATRVHLLDRRGRQVPLGVAGELAAAGDGLARGYLGRPDLTAESFVPDFCGGGGGPGERLYRTGDLARRLPDGRIEFLGRLDQQVKVRGYRIEPGEVEARLAEHPAVRRAAVMVREDVPGDRRLVAYVVQDSAWDGNATASEGSGERTEQVEQWGMLFDDLYNREAADSDPTFNIVGWESSYTGQPLPRREMEAWVDDTVGRILALRPRRVLEIGCGTGLLLFRIAPGCAQYTGTDLSAAALAYVGSQLGRLPLDPARVRLLHRPADRFDGIADGSADGSFDTVIINSVAQYFPSAGYLAEVVAGAVRAVRPGGAVFLGDLRSLPLLDAFHTAVELEQAEGDLSIDSLRRRIQTRRMQENELVIDPAFFAELARRLPAITRIEIHPKRGRAHNELTAFRYQAVLRVGPPEATAQTPQTPQTPQNIEWLDWDADGLTLGVLRDRLESGADRALGLRRVPNARTAAAAAAVRLLAGEPGSVAALRAAARAAAAGAVDPQDLWELERELPWPCDVELGWSDPGDDGRFDAVLVRRGESPQGLLPAPAIDPEPRPWTDFTNDPLQGRFSRRLAPELRDFVAAALPESMIPTAFVLLDSLPLSPNGKVDRRRLPAPGLPPAASGSRFVAPRTPTEERLAAIWADLLGIDRLGGRVGAEDDFFELGGHSLLATQVVSRVRETFGVELPLRAFFEAATVTALARTFDALLHGSGGLDVPPLVPVPRGGALPLSFAQERLWFLQRFGERLVAYNEAASFRMRGPLDVAALRWSLDEIVRRHETLRTAFPESAGQVEQRIAPAATASLPLPLIDLSALPSGAREAAARRLGVEQALRLFDLENGPLVRTLLVRFGAVDHAALFSFHHIVFDGWSTSVFVRELSVLYAAERNPAALPPLAVQYADFACWQRGWLHGEALERQIGWWRERLDGAATLELPTDRPHGTASTVSGLRAIDLGPELTAALHTFARRRGATPFMVLLAAFKAVLRGWSGQDDVTVGSTIANRNRLETEGLIGFFVNMLVLRTDLGGDPGFRALVERTRETALGAFAHQDLPFERLVEELRPERDLQRTLFFQAAFQVLPAPPASLDLPGVGLEPFPLFARQVKFDLEVGLFDLEEGIAGTIGYDAALFDAATVDRLRGHFERLLAAAVADPGRSLAALPWLTPAEEHQAVREWNDGRSFGAPATLRVDELFAAMARRQPAALAVSWDGGSLTYGELAASARRLASRLRRSGIRPEMTVAVCLDRSSGLLTALLGILQAGGAYVPLDPDAPRERLAYLVADAAAPVLITERRFLERLPREIGAEILLLDDEQGHPEDAPREPEASGRVGDLAYAVYTSGSTGLPKAVAVEHASLLRLVEWTWEIYGVTPADRATLVAAPSFDASVAEIWPYLTAGASLHIPAEDVRKDPSRMARWLAEERITLSFLPTPLAEEFLAVELPAGMPLRALLTGGDRLRRVPGEGLPFLLVNHYGPTEGTVLSTWTPVLPGSRLPPPIGRPAFYVTAYVLDAASRAVGIGIAGELWIGGAGIARGYLRRPELTADRFRPDPFGPPGSRLYHTGDRVRRLADGQLAFLGRTDDQIKVRGVRLEPGEVEAALVRHPGVRTAAVGLRGEGSEARLVAWIVPEDGAVTPDAELRAFLRERLPEAAVPAVFVPLEALPLNPNGKVDRRALPEPPASGAAAPAGAPRTPVEEILVDLFRQVLRTGSAGAQDGFFDLGGHSLLAIRLASRLREAFGVEIPLRAIFEHPTPTALAAEIERSLRAGAGGAGDAGLAPPILKAPRDGGLPLSFPQQRLWIVDRLEPGLAAYNMPFPVRFAGRLDAAALEWSLGEVVRRHEVLRTRFAPAGGPEGGPAQVVLPADVFSMPRIDLRALPADRGEEEARRLAAGEAARPFDLETGPLVRATLLDLPVAADGADAAEEHALFLTLHHIASDAGSLDILGREMAVLYAAFLGGQVAKTVVALPELPIQYADYAVWQRQWLRGEVVEKLVAWWRERLAGAATLELPADHPRPAVQSFRGARVHVAAGGAVAAALRALGQRNGATSFMVLLAALQALLYRYSGQDDVVVGTPSANRDRAEIEGLIGFFVNMLTLRVTVDGDLSFSSLLARARETALGAYTHRDLPFEKLVEEVRPERDLGRNPLFQVAVQLFRPAAGLEWPEGLQALAPRSLGAGGGGLGAARFDLDLSLVDGADGFAGTLEYSRDLFEHATAARMASHLESLLAGIAADPETPVAALPLLTTAAAHHLLVEQNDTRTGFPRDLCITGRFAAVAAERGDAPAVEFAGERLTYAELDRRAAALAHRLRRRGVQPGDLVGIFVERSAGLAVALLGVLKAGGAYLPLDPAYPTERLAFMLRDAAAVVVVTDDSLGGRLPAGTAVIGLNDPIDPTDPTDPADPIDRSDLPDENLPESLAYVIYTSGSTGTPKGVAVTHRAVLRLVLATDYVALGPSDRVAQASNASFDAATFEIWGALLNGACLVGMSRAVTLEPRAFAAALRDDGITTLFLTTALFNQLAREAPGAFSPLRSLLFGGELVDPGMVRRVLEDGPPRRLLHVYGPTEGTTFTSWYPVESLAEGARTVPIGRPLANTSVVLLDAALRPVPPGVVGELYAGGEGLACCYLGRPELTAERFIPAPGGEVGSRLYRTGDLARRQALQSDNAVVFLGRADQQVKVRGFRIEPGEVEAALTAVPGVAEAVVVVREEGGDRRLVAYLTGAAAPAAAELRERLARRLPDHMVPAAFVHLAALPLTPNGKIDRAALPAPERSDAAAARDGAAPRTPVEEILAAVWAELLGVDGVTVDDDFFALGGHSLLAVQLISRVRAVCGVEVPLRALFEAPTIAGLAAEVESALRAGPEGKPLPVPPLVPLPAAARESGVPLSWAQQRLWILDQLEMGSTAYNMPMAVRLSGDLGDRGIAVLAASLGEIVRRHEALRTGFAWMDGDPAQVVKPFAGLTLPRVDLTALPAAARRPEALRLARAEAGLPFDLWWDALLRLTLLTLAADEHVLLVTMHHIVSDGWSMGVLMREMSALYTAFHAGRPSPLAELPVQYADYSAWQRQWLQGDVLESQLAYWREALADAAVLELPTDRPRRSLETYAGSVRSLVLTPQVGAAHAALGRAEGVTLFMSLLAAWSALLRTYAAGQTDIVVGTPVANRGRMEIEGLIGFFVNTLVLRTRLEEPDSGREIVRRVRETALGAFAHQDIPFQKLVEELQPKRSLQRSPFFQVFFILQNAGGGGGVPLPGVAVEPLSQETTTAKLELTLSLTEGPAGIQAVMEHNTDLYDSATIDRMLRHFAALAAGIALSPDAPAADLPLLSAAERQQAAVEWNDTRRGGWEGAVIHRVFAACAAAAPAAPAVVWADGPLVQRLTYGELDRQADRLARRLRRAGVGPEVPVGVFLERSPELFVAFLAVLKAGGVYVPLEATHPVDRLLYMLADAKAPVVVTRRAFEAALPAESGLRVVAIDGSDRSDGSDGSDGSEEEAALPAVTGANLAYILYTSGSTGRPKGVAVTHEGVVRLARDSGFFSVTPEDTFLQITALSFDVSTFEIWGSLLNGARLALPVSPAPTLEEVGASIALHGVSILWLTSGLFGLMADRRIEDLRSVRQLLAGGDILPVPQVRRVVEELPETKMINGYGPTENTTFTTCRAVTAEDVLRPSIPIGVPIGNTTAHIVDAAFRLVPAGVRGELCTGGLGVARGYLGLADLTAERFVPDPWGSPGSRLYRTGDLARRLPDGSIEFFGRADAQVKIRGFRIEPDEVQTLLGRHPEVAEAVVTAREDRPGDRRLVAYVVPSGASANTAPVPADLQAFLRRSLPDYMIPGVFVFLAAFPLTANGKIDRRALPAPEDASRAAQASYTPPRTELERRIVEIWREVLDVPQVGVHDNFFDLGGHSLLLLRVVSRLNEEIAGRELSRAVLFEHPTVAALAAVLEAMAREEAPRASPSAGVEAGQDRAAARRESLQSLQSLRHRRGRKDGE
ncbi:MAG TPA: amino acid adenylation domain-containing protein [Thermoanaerobaculia bacterium]|nr:amino acid adenylation domain-containing protein [Thermoanaerobaculia bacterium]